MQITRFLYKILPEKWFIKIRKIYRTRQSSKYEPLSYDELKDILINTLKLQKGDHVLIHSSMDFLKTTCNPLEILNLLLEIVGKEGALLFPCWHSTKRAEELLEANTVFDVRKSPSVMGMLSELARRHPEAKRSLHPTNSIVAIGSKADYFVNTHHNDIYPCGTESPLYKLVVSNGKTIGIGVDATFMSFIHCPEDVLKSEFPFKTRNEKIYDATVIGYNSEEMKVKTLVASKNISNFDIRKFVNTNIEPEICQNITIKSNRFFRADCKPLFDKLVELSKQNITIYNQ
ncbi:MAG: AAC(3) family N-acetyltransferase [Lentimicrobiaceae bacterium]|nr:AAC(3) family N-acetyltransferase [Lentimicrobiaceae bacterium]